MKIKAIVAQGHLRATVKATVVSSISTAAYPAFYGIQREAKKN